MLSEKHNGWYIFKYHVTLKLYESLDLLCCVIFFESQQKTAGKCTKSKLFPELSFFPYCAEGDKQVEKLKAVTTKLPHLPVIRIKADAGIVPLSRGSEARSVSFGSHSVSSQVKITFCQMVFVFLLTSDSSG